MAKFYDNFFCEDIVTEANDLEYDERDVSLNGSWAFIIYSQAKTEDKEEFLKKLKYIVPEGTEIYGGKEAHNEGGFHYHVIMRFPKRVNWTRARRRLMIEGETKAIQIRKPPPGKNIAQFANSTQNDVEKSGDVFGERIDYSVKRSVKRIYEKIHEEEDYDKKKRMIMLADPKLFRSKYTAVMSYLKHESKRRNYEDNRKEKDYEVRPWDVPQVMIDYVRDNIVAPPNGRRKSLILVGKSRTGKTEWAESHGECMVMTTRWNVKNVRDGYDYVVVHDVNLK